jgi:hypothetical protein
MLRIWAVMNMIINVKIPFVGRNFMTSSKYLFLKKNSSP